jgi:hypothetical protein
MAGGLLVGRVTEGVGGGGLPSTGKGGCVRGPAQGEVYGFGESAGVRGQQGSLWGGGVIDMSWSRLAYAVAVRQL